MRIDVWSDIVCPYCHVGRRHLELALARFAHADEVAVVWHSFELDRSAPAVGTGSNVERVAAKYGVPIAQMRTQHEHMAAAAAAVGLDFAWQQIVPSNSYAAHRLIHYARSVGREQEVTDVVMRAWYSEGAAIGDHAVLLDRAVAAGLPREATAAMLVSDDFGIDVRTDQALAGQIGITAVPAFILDQKFAVAGAQPVDVLLRAIEHAWADQGNRPEPPPADGCGSGGCGSGACGSGACGSGVCDDDGGGACAADGERARGAGATSVSERAGDGATRR